MTKKKQVRKAILKKRDKKIDTIAYGKLDIMWFFQWLKLAVDMEGQSLDFGKFTNWDDAKSLTTRKGRYDETQKVANKYGAVCTPDFFGYNKNLELQYRGRIRELKNLKPVRQGDSDLKLAMKLVAKTGKGPKNQVPSMGCNIKWFK